MSVYKTSQFSYSLAFPVGWIPSLLHTAVACDDGGELFFLKVLLPYRLLSPSRKYAANTTTNSVAPST